MGTFFNGWSAVTAQGSHCTNAVIVCSQCWMSVFCLQIWTTAEPMNLVKTEEPVKTRRLISTCARVPKDSLDSTARLWIIPAPQPPVGTGARVMRVEDSIIAHVRQGGRAPLVTSVSTNLIISAKQCTLLILSQIRLLCTQKNVFL
jgi:hypothetical protein